LTAKLHNRKREFDFPDTLLPAVFNAQHFNGALILGFNLLDFGTSWPASFNPRATARDL